MLDPGLDRAFDLLEASLVRILAWPRNEYDDAYELAIRDLHANAVLTARLVDEYDAAEDAVLGLAINLQGMEELLEGARRRHERPRAVAETLREPAEHFGRWRARFEGRDPPVEG
jgi:hypothetical protein